jgi:hypothetical protein
MDKRSGNTSGYSADSATVEIQSWRRDQLLRTGFEDELASQLASDPSIDLHTLIELVERGCSPEQALRILAPLENERWGC